MYIQVKNDKLHDLYKNKDEVKVIAVIFYYL